MRLFEVFNSLAICFALRIIIFSAMMLAIVPLERPAFALEGENFLIGKWSRDGYCQNPFLIFSTQSIEKRVEADGHPVKSIFERPTYVIASPNQVTVDFGQPHGFGQLRDSSKATFAMSEPGKVLLRTDRGQPVLLKHCQ